MGMITNHTPDVAHPGGVESFESRSRNRCPELFLFNPDSSNITSGYTQVASISNQRTDRAVSSKTPVRSEPLAHLLRRTKCRAVSEFLWFSGLRGWLPPVRHLRRSPNRSLYRSSKKSLCLNIDKTRAGRRNAALPDPANPLSRRRLAC